MLQRLRLAVLCALQEQLALPRHAFVEGQGGGRLQGVDDALRREQILLFLGNALASFVEVAGRKLAGVDVDVANLAQRSLPFSELASIADGAFEQIAVDHFVDHAGFRSLARGDGIA